jgi:peptidoglycan/LPS O-acetylase OafA/YrhL
MSARRSVHWTAHLRRRTTTGQWLPEIDGLRFVAIFSVLLFHLQGQFDHHYSLAIRPPFALAIRAFGFGNRGVPLFFAISGFVLALPFARHYLFAAPAPSLHRYYVRRLTRLEPPYLANLILVAIAAVLLDHSSIGILLPHLAASMCYLHYAIFGTSSPINSVAWSLEVEAQFYLLAPALAMVFALQRPAVRRTALVAAMLAAAQLQSVYRWSNYTLAGDLQYFLAGLLLADFYLTGAAAPLTPRKSGHAWDFISLVGWPAFFLLSDRFTGLWLPLLILLLCLAALRGNLTSPLLRRPAIAITGGMCYTVYLWHAPVFTVVDRALRAHAEFLPANYFALYLEEAALKLAAVALVCLPLFILIERPCMDPLWLPKLFARLRRRRTPADVLVPN